MTARGWPCCGHCDDDADDHNPGPGGHDDPCDVHGCQSSTAALKAEVDRLRTEVERLRPLAVESYWMGRLHELRGIGEQPARGGR